MEKYKVNYLGRETDVIGRYQLFDGRPDFCCELVTIEGKPATHKLYTPDFLAIEKLALIERLKGINLDK